MPEPRGTLLICCGAIAKEMVALIGENRWTHLEVQCLPARLHNTPDKIPEAVRAKIRAARGRFQDILVLYGDCGTGGLLDKVLAEEGVERIPGNHCYDAYAGSGELAGLMAQEPGTFFVTDFLARHFDRLVIEGLGLDRFPRLRDRYFGKYRMLVYLAQSDDPGLETRARRAAERLGLGFEKRHTGYGEYERFLAARAACPRALVPEA
jgi:hypothetical protein